jgi:metalloendopeptidase OMA1, mitochondrial
MYHILLGTVRLSVFSHVRRLISDKRSSHPIPHSLERVPETGRLRFIDVSPDTEASMSLQAQQETLSQYRGKLLSPNSVVARRVKEVATRIVEMNGLGTMKEEGFGAGVQRLFSGGEGGGLAGIGEMMFGRKTTGGAVQWDSEEVKTGKDVEWEVSFFLSPRR